MKLKQRPSDFRVTELCDITPAPTGVFSFYRLEKTSIGTPEALQAICRQLQIDSRGIRYGGLKDKHAVTTQFLTIENGPKQNAHDELWNLTYLGQLEEPYGPQSFRGNHFQITLRDIPKEEKDQIETRLQQVATGLIANYFDDQRFGSVSRDGRFVAKALIQEDEELAIKLALAEPYEHDRSSEKKTKRLLRENWGNWVMLFQNLQNGPARNVVGHLKERAGDFRGAFPRIPFFLKNMYLSAYQSYLWNRTLHLLLEAILPSEERIEVHQKNAKLWMPRTITEQQRTELAALTIPLLSSRVKLEGTSPVNTAIEKVLAEEKLQLADIKLKHYRDPFFSKGDRAAFLIPENFKYEFGWDKFQKGNRKLTLEFSLPRGSYATMVVKRIMQTSDNLPMDEAEA